MSQPMCVQIVHLKTAKWYDFHPDDKVSYMIQYIAMENDFNEANFALLVVDKDGGGQWMREDYPFSFYLDAASTYEWRKRHRPVKVIMPDSTYRTQLVDDTLKVELLTDYIGQQFGFSGCVLEKDLDPNTTDVLVKDMTLREQGYYGSILLSLVNLTGGGHGLYVRLAYMCGKLVKKGGKLSSKSKRYFRLKKNKFAAFKDAKCTQEVASALVKEVGSVKKGNSTEEDISSKHLPCAFTVEMPDTKLSVFVAGSQKERDSWVDALLESKATFTPQKMFFAPVGPPKDQVASYRRSDQVDVEAAAEMDLLKQATAAVEDAKRIEAERLRKLKRKSSLPLGKGRNLKGSTSGRKSSLREDALAGSPEGSKKSRKRDSLRSFQSVDSSQVQQMLDKKKKRLSGEMPTSGLSNSGSGPPQGPAPTPESLKKKPKIKVRVKGAAAAEAAVGDSGPPSSPPPSPLVSSSGPPSSPPPSPLDDGPPTGAPPTPETQAAKSPREKKKKKKKKKSAKASPSVFPVRISVEECVTTTVQGERFSYSSSFVWLQSTTIYAPMPLALAYSSDAPDDDV